ncbi:MAG: hypothetical protein NT023_15050 [Armatimonadetes bacterium]|nr:hypothetical protein [Armatimonadota bacterium]
MKTTSPHPRPLSALILPFGHPSPDSGERPVYKVVKVGVLPYWLGRGVTIA